MPTLYKFRPLNNCDDFKRIREIIANNTVWFSPLWDQNDSMEAVYNTSHIPGNLEQFLAQSKMKAKICSFSSENGLYHPLMWANYASGFKGVAIEIEPSMEDKIHEVIYRIDPTQIPACLTHEEMVRTIITSKSKIWKHESEFRAIQQNDSNQSKGEAHIFGNIKSIIFGKPYGATLNFSDIYKNSEKLQLYIRLANKTIRLANAMKLQRKVSYLMNTPTGPVVKIRELETDEDFCTSEVTSG